MWWRVLLIVLACLLTGAHFLRYSNLVGALAFAAAPLLCFGREYALRALQLVLLGAVVAVWGVATFDYVSMRLATGAPWIRLLCIMSAVMVFVAFAAWCCEGIIRLKRTKTLAPAA